MQHKIHDFHFPSKPVRAFYLCLKVWLPTPPSARQLPCQLSQPSDVGAPAPGAL